MNSKIKFFTALSVIAIALTACSGLPEEVQNLDNVSVSAPISESAADQALPEVSAQQPEQVLADDGQGLQSQAPDSQTPDGQGPQGQNDGQQPPQIDFAAAASTLGITEDELKSAMGEPGQGPPDFLTVAAQLGISEEALITALGLPAGGPDGGQQGQSQNQDGQRPQQGQDDGQQRPQIDLATAASTLGVTEDALKTALGEPGQGKPDLAIVATELGVTEEALIDALGIPAGGPGNVQGQQS
ncbi:MAG: hypothetical protein HN736_13205 [Anaerolineae bacterium]|jgi:hypothetical protein|nr:hypothetical protein [Anaerolineae bacterium]MBT3714485.1 hypothetical protein [Anaerolineae bacterium]MBT4312704.1 hypothetical protein [Anaerolineae bacterium]MBT4458565.1 hypothetical protein [Anaerolineae bacterium]MBT4843381.1 hypothetical protein [Anaerolineae bacterium]